MNGIESRRATGQEVEAITRHELAHPQHDLADLTRDEIDGLVQDASIAVFEYPDGDRLGIVLWDERYPEYTDVYVFKGEDAERVCSPDGEGEGD